MKESFKPNQNGAASRAAVVLAGDCSRHNKDRHWRYSMLSSPSFNSKGRTGIKQILVWDGLSLLHCTSSRRNKAQAVR